jgi:hypothetical protein
VSGHRLHEIRIKSDLCNTVIAAIAGGWSLFTDRYIIMVVVEEEKYEVHDCSESNGAVVQKDTTTVL